MFWWLIDISVPGVEEYQGVRNRLETTDAISRSYSSALVTTSTSAQHDDPPSIFPCATH